MSSVIFYFAGATLGVLGLIAGWGIVAGHLMPRDVVNLVLIEILLIAASIALSYLLGREPRRNAD